MFQYACCALAAEAHGAKLLLPPDWPGRTVLAEAAAAQPLEFEFEAGLPLCADRPLLSHAGWRAWASSHEPLASAAQRGALSGRQARALALAAHSTALTWQCAGAPPGAAGERERAVRGWLLQRRQRRRLRRRACGAARLVGLVCF